MNSEKERIRVLIIATGFDQKKPQLREEDNNHKSPISANSSHQKNAQPSPQTAEIFSSQELQAIRNHKEIQNLDSPAFLRKKHSSKKHFFE